VADETPSARPLVTRLTARARSSRVPEALAVGAASLIAATAVAAALEQWLGVADASPVYLLAVVAMAGRYGPWAGIGTSVVALLVYDYLFVEPRFTLTVADPQEWLSLLLFFVVAVVIGRLTALQAERTEEARRRAGEGQALFAISRTLATTSSVEEATTEVVERLRLDTDADRVWIGIGPTPPMERVLGDSAPDEPRPDGALVWVLRGGPDEPGTDWIRVHAVRRRPARPGVRGSEMDVFRVPIAADGEQLGSVWAVRTRAAGRPSREATRIMALAADQLGLVLHREQLAREATEAEIARQSDALKSALLDSVSHDLRTPLSSIRAAAGSLMDPLVEWSPDERWSLARSIDVEAERLSLVVRNLLDLSRIQAGAIVPELEVFELRELVEPVVARISGMSEGRSVSIDIDDALPPVLIDAVFLDESLTNLLENAVRYAPPPAPIRVAARSTESGFVTLVVEDGGPGVPVESLESVFDKFYRVARPHEGARRGMGIGLAVVRGLVEAMGGRTLARASELGGLAIELTLPIAASSIGESGPREGPSA
jgi:two-component system sensor histidine kinase KdpD